MGKDWGSGNGQSADVHVLLELLNVLLLLLELLLDGEEPGWNISIFSPLSGRQVQRSHTSSSLLA